MKRQQRSNSQGSDVFEDESGGRVQVYVRIRPLVESDVRCYDGRGALTVADVDLTQICVVDGKKEKTFQFDQILPSDACNEEVYQVVGKPLVEASMTGLNSILMAYGQTGTGKTHTLMASDGLAANIVTHIFALVNRDAAHSYAVTCSYLQIYQERVYDLLGDEKSGPEVYLREHPKKGVYIENLSEYFVKCPEEIGRLLKSGKKKLAIAETKMNRQSSRSHAVCLLKIERLSVPRRFGGIADSFSSYESYYVSGPSDPEYSSDGGSVEAVDPYLCYDENEEMLSRIASKTRGLAAVRGKLYVCDLAGSERVKKTQAEGERLQEAQSINSSLLELGNVIQALAEGKKRHIPYRNSTLTRLLQDGLDGNSKTSLIICVSPSCRDVNETLCSLKFGLRAMKVHNIAQVNVEIDFEKMAKQLADTLEGKEREWRRLKTDYESYIMALEAERDGHQSRDSDQPNHDNHSDPTAPQSPQSAIFSVTLQDEALKNQTKAVLLAELVSMELFYGLEDLLREDSAGFGKAFPTEKLYGLTDRDLLLHSAETLLELTEYFFTKSTLYSDDATRTKGLGSTDTPNEKSGRTSRLLTPEECGRHSTPINDSSYTGKLLRVRETLCRLKKTTDSAALSFFSSLFDSKLQENGEDVQDGKRRLHELLQDLLKSRKSSPGDSGHVIDSWKLEQSLCHVLMDKALLNCLFLLDKADMESRIKTYKMQQSRFDYSGFNNMTPVQLECCSQSGDEIPPSPPLPRGRAGEGRLTSVDEGVVLESSSDSANSREKLTAHFENAVEELEAENKLLCEKNEEAENEKSELTLKVLELERKLKRSEQKLAYLVQLENSDEVELTSKVEEKEFESQELFARVDELEDELHVSERTVSSLRESERRMLSEEKRRAEAGDEQRAKLHLKIRQLEDKLEESELKLASYTGSDFLENNKITKQLESAIAENTELNVRILHLEEKLKECGNVSTSEDYLCSDDDRKDERCENQTRTLERKILDLEGKLKEQDVKIASVKEYERRLRAELCKEMTKKLTRAQTRSRDLGEKILELEARLWDAEQQCTRVRGLDTNSRNVMSEDVRALTSKLQDSDARNRELSLKLQEIEERYRVSQDNALIIKQSESNLREKVQWLELENCKLQEKVLAQKEKSKREPCSSRTAGRLEKVRNENSNLAAELKSFRENLLNLEGQLLAKDQVILSLRNDSVDLSSESSELRAELDASLRQKGELERELARYVKGERELVMKLDRMQEEVEKLRVDLDAAALSNVTNVTVTNDNDKDKRVDTDCRSDSTSSTLLIGEKNAETSVRTPNRNETFTENRKSEKSVEESSADVDKLLKENKSLLIVVDELGTENSRITRKNERLLHEVKTLETNLSVVERTFGVCRAENDCLLQEINLKSAEATTVRTYASFCSEETKKLKSELATHRRNEAVLEKRLTNLESESLVMRNEMGRGISEFSDLRENKDSLEKRIIEASRVVDQLKQEILSLTKGMLTLQKETNTQVDKIMLCLGLDEKRIALSRVRHGQRPESVDSNCTSTQTEGSSDEISSEMSESHARKWSFSCRLLPDEECFINPSDVSVMRENKSEIRNLHEELRSKMLAVKDALSRVHGVPLCNSAADLKEENGRLGMNRKSEVKIVVESEALRSGSKGGVVLPRLSKAERVKLSSLLTTLKEELIREKERNYVAQLGCDDNDICSLYDNLESKLSRLSCELATKEDEISDLLAERTLLEEELDACEKGLGICRHCSAKVPDSLEDRRTQLKGSLLAHMQESSRLEGEIFEFMEYRQRLEGELSAIKSQITDLEEELDVRKILIERCIGFKPSRDESDSSKDDTDTLGSSSPGKKRKSQKHVTFESVDSEPEDSKRRRQKPDKCHAPYSEDSPGEIGHWRATDLDSSDLDLCELLNSIPRDVPKKLPTREELEIAECANRLSAYDNMSFKDKVVFATERRKSETDSADGRAVKRVLFNGGEPACNGGGIDKVGVDYGDDEVVSCQLCGLFRKRS